MTPSSVQAVREHGLILSGYAGAGFDRGVMLVPDGVARVTLANIRLRAPRTASLRPALGKVASTVTDNFALLTIAGLTTPKLDLRPEALGRYLTQSSGRGCRFTSEVYSLPATAEMTWFTSSGAVIRRGAITLELDVGAHQVLPSTSPRCRP